MNVWQSSWDLKALYLWGERAVPDGRSAEEQTFACDAAELARELTTLELDSGEEASFSIYLPSSAAPIPYPLPSPRAAGEMSAEGPLRAWEIPALKFDPLGAVNLLSALPSNLPGRPDDSLLYWVECTKLLLELLCRGRFLPGLGRAEDGYRASWSILTNENVERLISAMPLCARAGSDVSAETALLSFLEECGDALIRSFLRSTPLSLDESDRSLAAGWLRALTSPTGELRGPPGELVRLEHRLKSWAGSVLARPSGVQTRTCFRLRESNQQWVVDFAIQSRSDDRQLLTAESLWGGELGFLRSSPYSANELQEMLLKDLGRGRQLFPTINRALKDLRPAGATLSLDEAYEFLRRNAALLGEAGFGVILPKWWHEPVTQLGLELSVEGSRESVLGLEQLLDYHWQVSIGGTVLTEEEFKKLVGEKRPLIFHQGAWVELEPEKLQKTLEFLENERSRKHIRLIDALRFGFGAYDDTDLLPVVGFHASGWLERFLSASQSYALQIEQPGAFIGKLRPYQLEGLSWLAFLSQIGIGGCLADDMGLGKTIQLLALLLKEREQKSPLPTLLVVPMSILGNWQSEAEKFSPSLRVHLHHGTGRLAGEMLKKVAEKSDLLITTYNLVYRDEAALSAIRWGRVALDEAQNIKNLSTKQTRSVRRLAFHQLAHGCERLVLTGTPLENRLEELWSIFDFLNPSYLGEVADFRRRFAVPIERFRDKEMADKLARLIRPFILRRLKSDPHVITDLPEKIEMDELVTLTPEQASLYQAALEEMLPQVAHSAGMHRKGLVLATITRLKQICDHPALLLKSESSRALRSGKIARLEEILEIILAEGDHVLIFTQFAQMGAFLQEHLAERFKTEVLFLHGNLSRPAREKLIERFQSPGGPQLFVLSLKAGGYGLNLTAANQVVHFDQWWNPAVEQQATDRAHRIGQKRSVQVRRLISRGTLEERIAGLLREKSKLASEVIGSSRNLITEMSVDELRDLLKLAGESSREEETDE